MEGTEYARLSYTIAFFQKVCAAQQAENQMNIKTNQSMIFLQNINARYI